MKKKLGVVLLCMLTLGFSLVASADERVFINSQEVMVISSVTDEGSGMHQMQFSLDDQITWTPVEAYAEQKNLTLPDLAEGEHCIFAKFSDQAGNWTLPIQACAWVDTTPPTGTISIKGVVINIEVNINK